MTDFTANGIWPAQAPIDWQYAHNRPSPQPNCAAYLQVQQRRFVPVFGTSSDPFVCIANDATTLPS